MKLSDYKDKIDKYFEEVSGEELIAYFEELGYEFEKIQPESMVYQKEASIVNKSLAFSAIFDAQMEYNEVSKFGFSDKFTSCESINVSAEGEYLGNRNISMAA